MDFTLHQLKLFHSIAENQSITKAAEAMFLTQPAVSIQLKKFQEQFSIPLTEVVGRQLYITEFGQEVAKAAEKILAEVDAINYQTMAFRNQLTGRLRISVASTGKYVMPYFLADFMHQHKGVELIMDVTNKALVVESLAKNLVDFSLVSVIPEQFTTDRVTLMENKLFLVGSTRLKRPKSLRSVNKLFDTYPLLYREPGSATRSAMETFIKAKNLPTRKKMELTSNEALKQAVIAGLGYSIMPLIGLKNALKDKELEIIPMKGLPIITQWNLIWLKSKKLSPVAKAYLDFVHAEKTRIIQENFEWHEKY